MQQHRPSSSCRFTATWRPPAGPLRRRARGSEWATCRAPAARFRAPCRATWSSFESAGCWPGTSPPGPPTGASTRRSAWSGRSTPPLDGWGGRRSSAAPGRGSSARRRPTGMGGWRRSMAPTRRSPWGCRPCSRRACPGPTRAPATAGSATTRPRCSSCCSPRFESRSLRSSSRGGRRAARGPTRSTCRASSMPCTRPATTVTTWPSSRWTWRPMRPVGYRRETMGRTIAQDPLFFAAPLAAGAGLAGAVRVRG